MDGIVALGHFCEGHGPCIIFSTQAFPRKSLKINPHSLASLSCDACTSIASNAALTSTSDKKMYVSSRIPIQQEDAFLLKQACVRSLSCEVDTKKDGGIVYFGDDERGHVFSHTFSLSDSLARGFRRLFTVIFVMKNKLFLLNSWAFLMKQMREISTYLQKNASKVNEVEQQRQPQRALRLKNGFVAETSRSLAVLTGIEDIFSHLHRWFSWMLNAASFIMSGAKEEPQTASASNVVAIGRKDVGPLREILKAVPIDCVRKLSYCLLLNLPVVIRGPEYAKRTILHAFSPLLNSAMSSSLKMTFNNEDVSIHSNVSNVPTLFVDAKSGQEWSTSWTSSLPPKMPTIWVQIEKMLLNDQLPKQVVETQLEVLFNHWKNITSTVLWTGDHLKSDSVPEYLLSQEVAPQDLQLLRSWANSRRNCDNA